MSLLLDGNICVRYVFSLRSPVTLKMNNFEIYHEVFIKFNTFQVLDFLSLISLSLIFCSFVWWQVAYLGFLKGGRGTRPKRRPIQFLQFRPKIPRSEQNRSGWVCPRPHPLSLSSLSNIFLELLGKGSSEFCFVAFLLWKYLVHVKFAPVLGRKKLKCHIAIKGNAKVANQMTWRTKVYIFYKYIWISRPVSRCVLEKTQLSRSVKLHFPPTYRIEKFAKEGMVWICMYFFPHFPLKCD